jgi:hypothetical protein
MREHVHPQRKFILHLHKICRLGISSLAYAHHSSRIAWYRTDGTSVPGIMLAGRPDRHAPSRAHHGVLWVLPLYFLTSFYEREIWKCRLSFSDENCGYGPATPTKPRCHEDFQVRLCLAAHYDSSVTRSTHQSGISRMAGIELSSLCPNSARLLTGSSAHRLTSSHGSPARLQDIRSNR